jgi:hypothetical protein
MSVQIIQQRLLNYDCKTDIEEQQAIREITQTGPWQNQNINTDKTWLLNELEKKINSINWKQATADVQRFIRTNEQASLTLWSRELFSGLLDKLK